MKKRIKVAFAGGGTLGPVTPLLATMKKIKELQPRAEFIWFGTPDGPEKSIIPKEVPFFDIPVAKFPRYPNIQWFLFPFRYLLGMSKARKVMKKEEPDIVVGAGGFTQVPVMMAADEEGIPSVIHQLDKEVGMSNRRVAFKTVSVTTSFKYGKEPFPTPVKSYQIATPVRFSVSDLSPKDRAARHFGLAAAKPITLIMGGGTGALSVNEAVGRRLDDLLRVTQIIHVTGKGKKVTSSKKGYVVTEFLTEDLIQAYSAADLIVSRAGMGSISECSALERPMILIPINGSHQEKNAESLKKEGGTVIVKQDEKFEKRLIGEVSRLLEHKDVLKKLVQGAKKALPTDDGEAFAKQILKQIV